MQLTKEKYDKSPRGAIFRKSFGSKIYKSDFIEATPLYGVAKCVNSVARLASSTSIPSI
jgi:hypothetical protein